MTTAQREAWSIAEQFTPMFRVRFEAERGADGPDEQELQSWLQQTLVYRHVTEDAGMFATWLVREYEAAYPTPYDCVVTYRVAYTEKKSNGVRIRRKT